MVVEPVSPVAPDVVGAAPVEPPLDDDPVALASEPPPPPGHATLTSAAIATAHESVVRTAAI